MEELPGKPILMGKKHSYVYADGKVVVQPFFLLFLFDHKSNSESPPRPEGKEESALVRTEGGDPVPSSTFP